MVSNYESWKCNYDIMALQQSQQHYEQIEQQQQQQQYAANLLYNLQYQNYQEKFNNNANKIEFHDPWEDYYRKEETKAEIQYNFAVTLNNENEKDNVQFDEDKPSVIEHQHYDVSFEHKNIDRDVIQQEAENYLDFESQNEAKEETEIIVSSCNSNCNDIAIPNSDETKNDNIESEVVTDTSQMENDNSCLITHDNVEEQIDKNTVPDNDIVCEQNENVEEAGLAAALSHLRLGEPRTAEQDAYEHMMRRQCWESGQIDYSGRDSFDNIWKKITETLESKPDNNGKTGSF